VVADEPPTVVNNTGEELEKRTLSDYLMPGQTRLGLTAAALQEQIDRHIEQAQRDKPDARVVIVAVADQGGVEVATSLKLPVHGKAVWSVGSFVRKEWKGDFEYGIQTRLVL
jgi:hypothetical protein